MTQRSLFWSSADIGGDYQSSYSDDEFALAMLLYYNYDRTRALIAYQEVGGSTGDSLNVVSTSGGNFVLAPIVALVDGRVYENDAALTLVPANGNGFYAVALLRRDATQTVRAELIYDAGVPPIPTQTAAFWECILAQCQVVGGVPQVNAHWGRPLPQNFVLPVRLGGDPDDWQRSDPLVYMADKPVIMVGVVAHTALGLPATISVNFPEKFKENSTPLVFVTPYNLSGGTPSHAKVIRITNVTDGGFSVTVDLDTAIEGFNWFAVGPEDEKRF